MSVTTISARNCWRCADGQALCARSKSGPDRVPARDVIVTLRGYLAVRLLFERAALARHFAERVAFGGSLSELRQWLPHRLPQQPPSTTEERAWPLFHVAQLCGLDASVVERWAASHVVALEDELSGTRRSAPPPNSASTPGTNHSSSPL